ncbi:MAG TPA: type VI secretion system protein TssL, partial [Cellvibrionales bacterium]|nr:type VI secretion system protein TssL [Cellvibrionales bacterium]
MFEIHAFGESLPARLNDSDENRAYNRRVHVELKR